MPGWVRATGIIVGILVLAAILMIALGHNPLAHVLGHAGAMQ